MDRTLLHIHGLPLPMACDEASVAVIPILEDVLTGWPMRIESPDASARTFLDIHHGEDGFIITRPGTDWQSRSPTAVAAASVAIVEIVEELAVDYPHLGLLHTGSVLGDAGLTLLLGTNHAGKSTLMARMSAAQRKVFSDDLLLVDCEEARGIATGCLPRPRLPLPEGCSEMFTDFVARSTVAGDGYYAYVRAASSKVVRFGASSPIRSAVILVSDENAGQAELDPVCRTTMLWALLEQDTRMDVDPLSKLRRYGQMANALDCWRLTYRSVEEGAAMIESRLLHSTTSQIVQPRIDIAPLSELDAPLLPSAPNRGRIIARSIDFHAYLAGDMVLLLGKAPGEIHRLDPLGAALWRVVRQPVGEEDLIALFCDLFPDQSRSRLRQDIGALVDALALSGAVAVTGQPMIAAP